MENEFKRQDKKDKIKVNKTFNGVEVITIIVVTLVIGIIVGYAFTTSFDKLKKEDNYLNEFINTYNDVVDDYYEKVDKKELIGGAISGMLAKLDDPYAVYLDENDTSDFNDRLNGSYSGIGVEITTDLDGNVYIANIFENSPADKAGLKQGDIFKKIFNKDVSEKTSTEISTMIKNSDKKEVDITVLRGEEEINVVLNVETIELDSVVSKTYDYNNKKVGYIDIDLFAQNTYVQFKNELEKLEKDKIDSLIIDVRDNTGGYLDSVTNIISLFLKENEIIYQLDEKGDITKILDETSDFRKYNIVVLINSYSASASEILASSLQESYGAKIVGTKSYGKGTVQETKEVDTTGGMLKYTVEKWLTPKGNWINEKGITPDVEVELDKKYYETLNDNDDNQLQNALEVITK